MTSRHLNSLRREPAQPAPLVREVRVADEDGNQLGVMTLPDTMKAAREAGLEVVEISPNAVPPVCKIVAYGKVC